ncbi:hypothetical protein BDN67DRAFT_1015621 [Paxillus ammoniavirescens]|nr:hypothetical protein BDN67DRAFT_1015621 [Paxillus ammoniavirescens]
MAWLSVSAYAEAAMLPPPLDLFCRQTSLVYSRPVQQRGAWESWFRQMHDPFLEQRQPWIFRTSRSGPHPTLHVGQEVGPRERHWDERSFCETVPDVCVLVDFAKMELHPCRENGMHYRLVSASSRRMNRISLLEDVDAPAKENGQLTQRSCQHIGAWNMDKATLCVLS